MAKVTAAEFGEKWTRRTAGATQDYQRGIDRVDIAPGQKAAANADKMFAKLATPEVQQKYRDRVAAVSLAEWKAAAKNKGAGRIAAGVQGASQKMVAFASQLLPHIDSVKSQLDSMPSTTLEDNINRMVTFTRGMAEFKY